MLLAFVLLVFGGATPGTSAAAPGTIAANRAAPFRPRIVLEVRVESARALAAARLRDIAAEVRAIWAPYVDVEIALAGDLLPPGLDDRLALVFTDDWPRGGSPDALGWIEFPALERPGRTIYASVAAARQLASRARSALPQTPPAELIERVAARALGRGVAHELGHYLLRSTAHSARGLMRARFTALDLAEPARTRFGLEPAQSARMVERLEQYARASLGPREEERND